MLHFLLIIIIVHSTITLQDGIVATSLESNIFRLVRYDHLNQSILSILTKQTDLNVQTLNLGVHWITVTGFSESRNKSKQSDSWIVFGGFLPTSSRSVSTNPFRAQWVGVVGCQLKVNTEFWMGFQIKSCELLDESKVYDKSSTAQSDQGAAMMGLSMTSLELETPFDGAVLVYCDPLWHSVAFQSVRNLTEFTNPMQPGGKCRIRFRQDGAWVQLKQTGLEEVVKFCTSSSGYSQPCAGGYSIDLHQTDANLDIPNVQLLIGLPLAKPNSEVRILDNILRNFNITNTLYQSSIWSHMHRIFGTQSDFGHSVRWSGRLRTPIQSTRETTKADLYVLASSSTNYEWPRIEAFRPPQGFGSKMLNRQSVLNFWPLSNESKANGSFTGFGLAVETVYIMNTDQVEGRFRLGLDRGVVVGAPFETVNGLGPNTGKVYLFCTNKQNATISGHRAFEYFGYSIGRLGDIDGDGVEDVVIGAPAFARTEDKPQLSGRVYIYRITKDCQWDEKPLQIIEAFDSKPGDGFGIGLSRGFDADGDHWPEFLVTSYSPNQPPLLYTMPKRFRAQCQIHVPSHYSMTSWQGQLQLPVSIQIRLFDQASQQFVPIPQGLLSELTRVHEIDPDQLWSAQFDSFQLLNKSNQTQHEKTFFLLLDSNQKIDISKPRFRLVAKNHNNPLQFSLDPNGRVLVIKFNLESVYDASMINLHWIPLHIAYTSTLNASKCNAESFDSSCDKSQHPLVDWSQCQAQIKLAQPICPPASECQSDLVIRHFGWIDKNQSPDRSWNAEIENPHLVVEYANSMDQHQSIIMTLANEGPTKARGIQIELTNDHLSAMFEQVTLGTVAAIQLKISDVNVFQLFQTVHATWNRSRDSSWSVKIAENGTGALISSNSNFWLYAGQSIQLEVAIFVEGLMFGGGADDNTPVDFDGKTWTPRFAINVRVQTNDPHLQNNRVYLYYSIAYKPKVEIYAGEQPTSRVDNRADPHLLAKSIGSRRVFSSEIGPKVEHTFLVENRGLPSLTNVTFDLQIPHKAADGSILIYLTDRIRMRSVTDQKMVWIDVLPKFLSSDGRLRGTCHIDPNMINPFDLSIVEGNLHSYTSQEVTDSFSQNQTRFKRSSTLARPTPRSRFDRLDPAQFNVLTGISSQSHILKRAKRMKFVFGCPRSDAITNATSLDLTQITVKCLTVRCTLDRLNQGDAVRLRWTGWLWSETIFNLHTPDIQLISRLTLRDSGPWPLLISRLKHSHQLDPSFVQIKTGLDSKSSFELKQSIIMRGVHLESRHQLPFWPIMVAVVCGFLLLSMLGAGLYCCGFFARQSSKLKRKMAQNETESTKALLATDNMSKMNFNKGDTNQAVEFCNEPRNCQSNGE